MMWRALALLALPLSALAQDAPRIHVDYSLQHERLTQGRTPWREQLLQLDRRNTGGLSAGARVRATERFSLKDTEAGAWLHQPFGGGWAGMLDLSASPTHEVLPKHALLGQLEKQLGGGWVVQAGLRRAEFNRARADLRFLGVERYAGAHRIAYTFYSGKPEGGPSAPSHRLQWSYYWNDRDTIGVSVARGREVENIAPAGLLTSDIRNLTVYGRYWFHRDWAMTAEASTHEQGNLYRRDGFRLGLRHQF